jgi:hypothetical protein
MFGVFVLVGAAAFVVVVSWGFFGASGLVCQWDQVFLLGLFCSNVFCWRV